MQLQRLIVDQCTLRLKLCLLLCVCACARVKNIAPIKLSRGVSMPAYVRKIRSLHVAIRCVKPLRNGGTAQHHMALRTPLRSHEDT